MVEKLNAKLRERATERRLARNDAEMYHIVAGTSRSGRNRLPVKRKYESDSDLNVSMVNMIIPV